MGCSVNKSTKAIEESTDDEGSKQIINNENHVQIVKQMKNGSTMSTNRKPEQLLVPVLRPTMTIFAQAPSQKAIPLEVLSTDTIQDIKAMIKDKTGYPPSQQLLTFKQYQMKEGNQLSDYNIQKFDTLYLTLNLSDQNNHKETIIARNVNVPLEVIVMTSRGNCLPINVMSADTIQTFKELIQTKTGVPYQNLKLTFQQSELVEGTLQDYNIKSGDKIVQTTKIVQSNKAELLRLYIRTLTGTLSDILVMSTDTINELKCQIYNQAGCPQDQQHIIFKGKQLEGKKLISDYQIQNESTLYLVLRLRGA